MISNLISMMPTLFYFLLIFSMQLLLILALRKPVRKWLGARVAYLLWLLPVVWIPFLFTGDLLSRWTSSVSSLFIQPETTMTQGAQTTSAGLAETSRSLPTEVFQNYISPVLEGTIITEGPARFVWLVLTIMWIAGMLLLFAWQASRLIRFKQVLKTRGVQTKTPPELKCKVSCLTLGAMDGPAVFGFLKPVLLLPEHFEAIFDADQRHLVLAHEAVHLRRRDNLWNLLAEGFRLLFWVNPLVHYAYRKYRLDQELSCDAAALELCTPTQQHRFARTLLKTSEPDSVTPPYALTAWDNLNELKERSMMVKHHIKQKRRPGISALLLSLLILSGATGTSVFADNTLNSVAPEGTLSAKVAALVNEIDATLDLEGKEEPQIKFVPRAQELLADLHKLVEAGNLNRFELYTIWMVDASVTGEDKITRLGAWWPDSLSGLQIQLNNIKAENEAEYTELTHKQLDAYNKALQYAANDAQKLPVLYRLSQQYLSGPLQNEETELDYLLQAYVIQSDYENVAQRISLMYQSNDQLQQALPFAEEAVINARKYASETNITVDDYQDFDSTVARSYVMGAFRGLSTLYYRMGYEEEAQELLDELEELQGGYDSEFMEL